MAEVLKKVRATRKGFKNGLVRDVGEVFEVLGSDNSSWYVDLESKKTTPSNADQNKDVKLDKAEILKWFEENQLEVDASLGVAKLREAHAEALAKLAEENQAND